MEKRVFIKSTKELLKEKGFIILKNNKYVIEYPECYVTLWFKFGGDKVVINYNVCFKRIHKNVNVIEDFNDWNLCDFNVWGILNHYCDTNKENRRNLLELDISSYKDILYKMLQLYIEPFNDSLNDIISFINKGRKYNYTPFSQSIYIEPYRFLSEAKEFLLENGMMPIEEFFE